MFLGKANDKIFHKMPNTLFLGPFCPILAKNEFSTKLKLSPFGIYSPLTSSKISEETNEPILRKTLTSGWVTKQIKASEMIGPPGETGKSKKRVLRNLKFGHEWIYLTGLIWLLFWSAE